MNAETEQAIAAEVTAEIEKLKPYQLELVYVDYRDGLDEKQVAALARGDWESLYDHTDQWVSEAQWEGANVLLNEIVGDLDDWDDAIRQDWLHTDAAWAAIDDLRERDTSTPLKDLAGYSGNVLLRVEAVDEDHAWSFEPIEPTELLDKIAMPHSENNLKLAGEIIANASPEYSVCMGYWLLAVNVIDLFDLPAEGKLRVTGAHFWLGNPFMGSGWADGPFDGEIVIDRADLRTDKDAFGYSWTEVVGGTSPSYYEAKIEPITEEVLT